GNVGARGAQRIGELPPHTESDLGRTAGRRGGTRHRRRLGDPFDGGELGEPAVDAAVDSPAWAAGRLRRSEMQMPPETRYVKLDAGYVGYQTFGHGPPACLFVTNWLQNLDVMWAEPTIA